jgi:hypothetical protein
MRPLIDEGFDLDGDGDVDNAWAYAGFDSGIYSFPISTPLHSRPFGLLINVWGLDDFRGPACGGVDLYPAFCDDGDESPQINCDGLNPQPGDPYVLVHRQGGPDDPPWVLRGVVVDGRIEATAERMVRDDGLALVSVRLQLLPAEDSAGFTATLAGLTTVADLLASGASARSLEEGLGPPDQDFDGDGVNDAYSFGQGFDAIPATVTEVVDFWGGALMNAIPGDHERVPQPPGIAGAGDRI